MVTDSSTQLPSRVWTYTGFFVLAAFYLFSVFYLRSSNQIPDDAFISLRYADNFADGLGFRFNPGGERIEGFSSPLHVVLLSGLIFLGLDPLIAGQISSILPGFFLVLFFAFWSKKYLGLAWGLAATFALAVNPAFTLWSRGGLETTLFTLWVFLAFMAGVEKKWSLMILMGGLISLTRPEGVLYWLPLVGWWLLISRDALNSQKYPVSRFLWMPAVYLVWLFFRALYFSDIFPNTYYAKMDGIRFTQLYRGMAYLWGFLTRIDILVAVFLILAAVVVIFRNSEMKIKRKYLVCWPVLASGLAACSVGFVLLAGGDHMSLHRFLVPVIPLIFLLGAKSAHHLGERAKAMNLHSLISGFLMLVFLLPHAWVFSNEIINPARPLSRQVGLLEPWENEGIPGLYKLGVVLGDVLPDSSILALVPAGAVPYASKLFCIDMLGLNDREIARQDIPGMGTGRMGHEKGCGELIMNRRPDFILLRTAPAPLQAGAQDPRPHSMNLVPVKDLWLDETFHLLYEPFLVPVDDNLAFTLFRRKMITVP